MKPRYDKPIAHQCRGLQTDLFLQGVKNNWNPGLHLFQGLDRTRAGSIIGTGIATNDLYFPELEKLRSRIDIVAVANRRRSKAVRFAKRAGVQRVIRDFKSRAKPAR